MKLIIIRGFFLLFSINSSLSGMIEVIDNLQVASSWQLKSGELVMVQFQNYPPHLLLGRTNAYS